jgi:CRISPR system Cascade subunit CasE
MSEVFFSRLTLRRESAAVAPLIRTFAPDDAGEAMDVTHRLLWTTMSPEIRDARKGTSTFLWRATDKDIFYVLGPRPTVDQPFFHVETRPFAPCFAPGDRLAFDLRANATVSRKGASSGTGRSRGKPVDVAIDRMQREENEGTEKTARAVRRFPAAEAGATEWFRAQGERGGFRPLCIALDRYSAERLPRRNARDGTIGVFDLRGVIEVADPDAFVPKVLTGFGRAKAFGCGLMLLRRAPRRVA